jgi:hypothetical protein
MSWKDYKMSTTSTTNLGLVLPVAGSSEPFALTGSTGINTNFEKIDTAVGLRALTSSVTTVSNNLTAEATTRGNADTALDARLDTLEARPRVYVQATDPSSGMVSGDLRFW